MAAPISNAVIANSKAVCGVVPCVVRRRLVWSSLVLPLAFAAVFFASVADAKAESAARYMQRVANELISAQRSGSASAFYQVLQAHADLPSIGLYSLGSYRQRLPRAERDSYYSGMIRYISRAVMVESPKYPVMKAIVLGQTKETKRGVYVDSVVTLQSGTDYNVRWWLIRRGSTFKVGDAEVVGFWARDALKAQFENYIAANGGNPKQLVTALNR